MHSNKIPGEAIRKLRHYKGFIQEDAAGRLAISQQAYSKLERSENVKIFTLHKAIKAFGCCTEDFEKLNGYSPPES